MRACFSLCVILRAFFVGEGCFGTDRQEAGKPISFVAFTKLVSGDLTKARLEKLLGKPGEVVGFKALPDSKETGESWMYKGLTIFFEDGAEAANTWAWHATEGSPEQKLKTAMSRYPGAVWEPETVRWINPHHFPNECYFKDKKQGISIEYNLARKEVFSITRWDPSRKLASSHVDENRPQFCIGNSCTPALSSEEFFKESPVSKYCETPK